MKQRRRDWGGVVLPPFLLFLLQGKEEKARV
jgi:hypothetical protein